MRVSDTGEFGLIDRLAAVIGSARNPSVVLGIGDDAAIWRAGRSLQIGTTDVLVQDVHFDLRTATWRDVGWKSLAINISDIAAMGGIPLYALVSLGLPGDTEVDDVLDLYGGLKEIADMFSVDIVGGNVSRSPVVTVNITVIGRTLGSQFLTRSAALCGDLVGVTGYLGGSAAGLKMLKSGLTPSADAAAFLREAHLRPLPRVAESQAMVRRGVKAGIDLSDGLLSDLGHVCKMSGVAARINVDSLPVHLFVRNAFPGEYQAIALSGGEDYEILFTGGREVVDRVKRSLTTPVSIIGEIVSGKPGDIKVVDDAGKAVDWRSGGWDHFRGANER